MPHFYKNISVVFLLVLWSLISICAYTQDVDKSVIGKINIKKNKKTRPITILRELEFSESDTILVSNVHSLLKEGEENLMNTSLFNFVTLKPVWNSDSTILDVEIEVLERWYVWPIPLFEVADRNLNSWWKDKDFSRLNYGLLLKWDNFTGRKDILKMLLRLGHEDKLGLFYELPSFNKKQNLGFEYAISYARHHEIGVQSIDNKLIYYRDDETYIHKYFDTYFRLVYRPQIHQKQYVELAYQNISFSDGLISEYPSFTQNNLDKLKFITLTYKLIIDFRDYVPYPLKGHYFDLELNKVGLGLMQSNGVDFFYLKSNLNFYWKLKNRWYYAAGLLTKFSNSNFQPYALQKGLGYKEDFIRSYELYVMDGQNFGLFRSNLKFELVPKRVHNFKFIRNEKFSKFFYSFYLNLFFDLAYVDDKYEAELNPLVNSYQYGYGLGLDLVTYYSLVFRVECSINKRNERFVFFHIKAPF